MNYDNFIRLYFELGLSQSEILSCLAFLDGVVISKSTLKRTLKRLRLARRKNYSEISDVAVFLLRELQNSGQCHGYRWMHMKCLQNGFNIPRDTVYHLLSILDPEGIVKRKRKRLHRRQYFSRGPDYVWHVDSYDKLKPYGIAINGCIDGYSRNIIWLEANITNSDLSVIADYYIQAVKQRKGCPQRIRADMGTENVHMEQMQKFLSRNHNDPYAKEKSFLYGKSTHNQRIEWFWGILRKEMGQFWMDLFTEMANNAGERTFSGDFLDTNLVQFCFMGIIQKDLDRLVEVWNTHSISGGSHIRGGNRPIMLYTVPELFDKHHCMCDADEVEINVCAEETRPKTDFPCDETVRDLCFLVMEENGYNYPDDAEEAERLYNSLRELILSEI